MLSSRKKEIGSSKMTLLAASKLRFQHWMDEAALAPANAKYSLQKAMQEMRTENDFQNLLVWNDWIVRHNLRHEFRNRINSLPISEGLRRSLWQRYWDNMSHFGYCQI